MIDRTDASRAISLLVRGGFEGRDDILETMTESHFDPDDLGPDDAAWIASEIDRQVAAKRADEKTWPAETDWDRLDRAFKRIEAKGVLALHCAGTTQSDSISDAGQEYHDRGGKRSGLKGYVFYHQQDVDGALETGELHIGFGTFDENTDRTEVPALAVTELVAIGFPVEWSGDPGQRIRIEQIAWRKRGPAD